MGIWDLFRAKPVGEDRVPPPDKPGAGVGAMKNGNEAEDELREALPHVQVGDAPARGNVVVVDLS